MKRARQSAAAPAVPVRAGRSLLLATVFFTNLLSLSCQVLWLRKISFLFGSTAFVFSTVLSIFLLGLAVGALWGGRVADRSARPWRLMGWLQIFLGAWVMASLPSLRDSAVSSSSPSPPQIWRPSLRPWRNSPWCCSA